MKATKYPLGAACEINPRLPLDHGLTDDTTVSFVPMALVDEVSGVIRDRHSRLYRAVKKGYTPFQEGDVLFAKITPCMENGKAAIARGLLGGIGFGSTEFHILRARNDVLPEWLYYFVRREPFRREAKRNFTGTAGQQRVPSSFLASTEIPIPSLPEQRRLIELLNRAEGIVRLRREAQTKAQQILPALFIDMFGDPSTNPKDWRVRRVGDVVARFEGGKNLQAGSDGGTQFRILKVSAVTTGKYLEAESKPTPEGYVPRSNHIVSAGDMLFSRANTEELVGATAIVEETNGQTLLPDKLWRFVWAEPVEPRYMHALFQNRYVRLQLGKLSSGTSASMRNISQGKLFELQLPVAPVEAQRRYALLADCIQSVCLQQAKALSKAEATFNALLAGAFSDKGEPSSMRAEAASAA